MSKSEQDQEYREKIKEIINNELGKGVDILVAKPSYTDLANEDKSIYVRVFHPSRRPSKREMDFVISLSKRQNLKKVYVASAKGFSESALQTIKGTNIEALSVEIPLPPETTTEQPEKSKKVKKRISKSNETTLIKRAKGILEEYFKKVVVEVKKEDTKGYIDVEARDQENHLVGIIRIALSPSIGVRDVRVFNEYLESQTEPTTIAALLTLGKVSPNARAEAQEYEIEILSQAELGEDTVTQTKLKERLLSGAKQMVRRMGYQPLPLSHEIYREQLKTYSSTLGDFLIAEDEKKPGNYIVVLIPAEEIVRVITVREFKKLLDNNNFDKGMIIARKKFTYTAVREASLNDLQILEKSHPVFDIYKHDLVPLHEILTPEEEKELLEKYATTKDMLPKIKIDDPAIKVLGGKPGQIVRIIRDEDDITYRVIIPSQRIFI